MSRPAVHDAQTEATYERAGWGGAVDRGARPALVVIDLTRGFTEPGFDAGADLTEVVAATGALSAPSIPRLPGLEEFEGEVFHSARWRHDIPLEGKMVAVVGTGASAVQFVPEIAGDVVRQAIGILRAGDIAILENTRFWKGEDLIRPMVNGWKEVRRRD